MRKLFDKTTGVISKVQELAAFREEYIRKRGCLSNMHVDI
jgi:hypothetical protein